MHFFKKYPTLVLLAATILLTILLWSKILLHPNDHLFGEGGDSTKNYYTALYYAKYDKGLHFSGMYYPYGEHVIYTDNMPLLSFTLSTLRKLGLDLTDYTIGIINALLMLSVIPCVLLLFYLARSYHLPPLYAAIISLIIGFLSPQLERFPGHYALGLLFFVPLIWYLLRRLFQSQKTYKWGILLLLTNLLFATFHTYYVPIASFLLLAYLLIYALHHFLLKKQQTIDYQKLIITFLAAIVPIILVKLAISLTDPFTDRHTFPFGIFHYTASFESIFLPFYSPFIDVWKFFVKIGHVKWEGQAYVGFVGLLVLFFTLIKWVNYIRKKQYKPILQPVLPGDLPIMFWAATLLLLYAMGVPFKTGGAFLLDWFPPLRQFRSLGRFAWVFYYVFTIYTAIYFYQIYRRLSSKGLKSIGQMILFLVLLSWASDAFIKTHGKYRYLKQWNTAKSFYNPQENYQTQLAELGHQPSDFQAIIPLPLYQMGSEKIYLNAGHNKALSLSCAASIATGLPIVAGYLARSSISRSLRSVQLISSPLIEKEILQDFPNQKPLFLLTSGEHLNEQEKALVAKATLIKKINDKGRAFYKLPLTAFKSEKQNIKQWVQTHQDSLFHQVDYWATQAVEDVVVQHFEEQKEAADITPFYGKGVKYQAKGDAILWDAAIPKGRVGQEYVVSCWLKIEDQHSGFPIFHYQQYDKDFQVVESKELNPKELSEIYKGWLRVSYTFQLKASENKIIFFLRGKHMIADELLIRPKNANVIYPTIDTQNTFLWNGYVID